VLLVLAGAHSIGAAIAQEDCLAVPNAAVAPGSHWFYRTDPVTQKKCWHIGTGDQGSQQPVGLEKPLPIAKPTPKPILSDPRTEQSSPVQAGSSPSGVTPARVPASSQTGRRRESELSKSRAALPPVGAEDIVLPSTLLPAKGGTVGWSDTLATIGKQRSLWTDPVLVEPDIFAPSERNGTGIVAGPLVPGPPKSTLRSSAAPAATPQELSSSADGASKTAPPETTPGKGMIRAQSNPGGNVPDERTSQTRRTLPATAPARGGIESQAATIDGARREEGSERNRRQSGPIDIRPTIVEISAAAIIPSILLTVALCLIYVGLAVRRMMRRIMAMVMAERERASSIQSEPVWNTAVRTVSLPLFSSPELSPDLSSAGQTDEDDKETLQKLMQSWQKV